MLRHAGVSLAWQSALRHAGRPALRVKPQQRRQSSAAAGGAPPQNTAPFFWFIFPLGAAIWWAMKDVKILYDTYTTPFSVHDIASDISTVNTKYGSAPLFLRLAWQSSCLYNPADHTGKLNGCLAKAVDSQCSYAHLPCCKGLDRAVQLLAPVKTAHPSISWPDLIALAGCVSVEDMGGPRVAFTYGREEGKLDVDLPQLLPRCPNPSKGLNHVKNVFYRMGFSRSELVALMGAHTVGGVHRYFSGANGRWTEKPFLFDNSYFLELLDETWVPANDPAASLATFWSATGRSDLRMLAVDVALLEDPDLKRYVKLYAENETEFVSAFALAFEKLMELGYEGALKKTSWRNTSMSKL
ncbi:putative heme-binding peroxidase [Diplonema papillatum]|nr:putative heme-binding peroxidase [Diplonema papillatum]|eukprot:gene17737-27304_t